MIKLLIWGTGKYCKPVCESLDMSVCSIIGFIDSEKIKQGNLIAGSYRIYSPNDIKKMQWDYIIVSARHHCESILRVCANMKIQRTKLILFWNDEVNKTFLSSIVQKQTWKIVKLEEDNRVLSVRLQNLKYELPDNYERKTPRVENARILLKKIINEKKSLCRFGDGEFEVILGNERPWFQHVQRQLQSRLREVLESDGDTALIAIADNFSSLEKYNSKSADAIREYMSDGKRQKIIDLLNLNKTYYDTYVSRPYIIYRTATNAQEIFPLFKKIWTGRNVLVVEGKYSRLGYRNDLLVDARSIRRIICPASNAFDSYDRILSAVFNSIHDDDLALISLGPTATVLSYDISCKGYQAIDIGQLDNEYDWFNMRAVDREPIPGKGVAELSGFHETDEETDQEFQSQIIARIV